MKKELAEFIVNNITGEIYEDYSGRGMYGDTTIAIITNKKYNEFFCEIFKYIFNSIEDILSEYDREITIDCIEEELKQIQGLCKQLEHPLYFDSLGKDYIIY